MDEERENGVGKKILREAAHLIFYAAFVVLLTFFVVEYVGQRTRVSGSSMEPSLEDGDNLIVDKLSYRFRAPKRFEVIVFPSEIEEGKFYIKRIIGLPGETVRIDREGIIYIDGEELPESYGLEVIENPGTALYETALEEGEYFVLGDNRNHSMDSRDENVGVILRDKIVGRAWLRIYPFNKFGWIRHD